MKNPAIYLFIVFSLCSCYDIENQVNKLDPNLRPKVLLEPASGVPANGADTIRVKIIFPSNPNPDFTKVNFTTTEGVFLDNNKAEYSSTKLFRDNTGTFYIYALVKSTTNKGTHRVTAEIPEVSTLSIPIEFLPSYPNAITTEKNKFAVARTYTDEIQLFANLSSKKGLPHKGTAVEFIVADSLSSNSSRLFRAVTKTDANGQASAFFTPGLFGGYKGPVAYKVITRDETGKAIEAKGTFDIVEPE